MKFFKRNEKKSKEPVQEEMMDIESKNSFKTASDFQITACDLKVPRHVSLCIEWLPSKSWTLNSIFPFHSYHGPAFIHMSVYIQSHSSDEHGDTEGFFCIQYHVPLFRTIHI